MANTELLEVKRSRCIEITYYYRCFSAQQEDILLPRRLLTLPTAENALLPPSLFPSDVFFFTAKFSSSLLRHLPTIAVIIIIIIIIIILIIIIIIILIIIIIIIIIILIIIIIIVINFSFFFVFWNAEERELRFTSIHDSEENAERDDMNHVDAGAAFPFHLLPTGQFLFLC
tara:strand:+ start:592 stop:1107 length:516 start_codon:yes stop_codon:yes gene_type:complete